LAKAEYPTQFSQPAEHILHPTDFTIESNIALAHALQLALVNQATLHLLHVGNDVDGDWDEFPSVRQILANWGLISAHASRSAVTDLGIQVEKVRCAGGNIPETIERYCLRHPIEMMVLTTAGRDGLAAWLKPSQAERIADAVSDLAIPTLFVPAGKRSCVQLESGIVSMDDILVPVDHQPNCESAVERGLRAIALFGGANSKLTLLHVGSANTFPRVAIPEGPWEIVRIARAGSAPAEILACADEIKANLIIMVTEGKHGFLDVLRGTTTAQVLRHAPCPLLAIPAEMQ